MPREKPKLHHLLALAGAKDTGGIARWLRAIPVHASTKEQRVLERFALAMSALSSDAFLRAADLLQAVLPDLPEIGGSQAQNQLFGQLATWAVRHAGNAEPLSVHRLAA